MEILNALPYEERARIIKQAMRRTMERIADERHEERIRESRAPKRRLIKSAPALEGEFIAALRRLEEAGHLRVVATDPNATDPPLQWLGTESELLAAMAALVRAKLMYQTYRRDYAHRLECTFLNKEGTHFKAAQLRSVRNRQLDDEDFPERINHFLDIIR